MNIRDQIKKIIKSKTLNECWSLATSLDRYLEDGGYEALRDRKNLRDRIKSLEAEVHHDPLTGCYNRKQFEEDYRKLIYKIERYGASYTLFLIDLDGFKQLNDTHGHQSGDEILKKFTRIIKQNIRLSDRLYRFGGDEFILVLRAEDRPHMMEKIKYLQKVVTPIKFSYGQQTIYSGVSLDQILKKADTVMYEQKRSKQNKT